MPYGTIKIDTVTFTDANSDKSVSVSGLVKNPTFSGNVTSTATISGVTIQGGTLVSGATVTGSAGQFTTITGGTANFTTITGGTSSLASGLFSNGTAALPSITFTNDPSTGISYVPTQALGFSVAGVQRAVMSASVFAFGPTTGDCGIEVGNGATANRAAYIDLVGDTTYTDYGLRILRGAAGANSDSAIYHRGTGALVLQTQDAGPIRFDTTGTERVRITADGKVGIGTSSPGARLDVLPAAGDVAFRVRSSSTTATVTALQIAPSDISTEWAALSANATGLNLIHNTGSIGIAANGVNPILLTTNSTERLRITSDGNVGIGTSSPQATLEVIGTTRIGAANIATVFPSSSAAGGSQFSWNRSAGSAETNICNLYDNAPLSFEFSQKTGASTANVLYEMASSAHNWRINNTERARIDSSGRLLVGISTARSNFFNATNSAQFQVEGSGDAAVVRNANDAFGSTFILGKSRSGGNTVVQLADTLGVVSFQGNNASEFVEGGRIECVVDATPGANDMPGRIVLSTTADGASTPTEQWRINNAGTVIYNQPAPAAVDTTATLTVANLTAKIITSSTAAAVTMTLPLGTSMDTGFSGLYTNMAFEWYVINTGATNAVTVQANTGHTRVGSATVAASNSGKFLSRRTAANAWVTYRLSS